MSEKNDASNELQKDEQSNEKKENPKSESSEAKATKSEQVADSKESVDDTSQAETVADEGAKESKPQEDSEQPEEVNSEQKETIELKPESEPEKKEINKEENEVAEEAKSEEPAKIKEESSEEVKPEVEGKTKKTEEVVEEYEFAEEEEEEEEDLDKLSQEELLQKIKEITGKDLATVSEKRVDTLREVFFHHVDHDREIALQEFLKDKESKKEDFEYTKDKELIQQFNTYYNGFKDQKRKHIGEINKAKDDNLQKKYDLLEQLRQFVDEEEDNVSVKTLKDIEEAWKVAEPIPSNYTRELWANFNALRDRFYDKRSIFFELKELDRKKNQTLKEEIIEKARELIKLDPVNAAVAELKKLHEEYKHIGPVPKEIRPVLWDEFKKLSDQIHERKQVIAAEFKQKLDENLEKKKELILKLENFIDYTSDKISDWNEKSREILDIQEQWKKIGPVPRELSKEISKSFWSHFKGFFKSKQQFFKALDEEREKNYEDKVKLCEEVEKINEASEDQASHSDRVKELQRNWKEIGPAPRKKSEAVYKRFKAACDQFFDNLRGHQKEAEKEYEVNLDKKNAIVDKLKAFKDLTEENLHEAEALLKEWIEVGFVPKKAIRSSKAAIHEGVDELLKKAKDFSEEQKEMASTKLSALLMKVDFHGNRNIRGEMDKIRRQISKLQDDTVTLKTNMEFFASTKNAEKLKDDVQKKIDSAEAQIDKLKNKIKLLRQIDN